MRTYTAWEPLQDPHFASDLDAVRKIADLHVFSAEELRGFASTKDSMLLLEADAMAVAEKVRASCSGA